jgi:hypothetical protein
VHEQAQGRLRSGASGRELVWALVWALAAKSSGHGFVDASRVLSVDASPDRARVGTSLVGG